MVQPIENAHLLAKNGQNLLKALRNHHWDRGKLARLRPPHQRKEVLGSIRYFLRCFCCDFVSILSR
jgi:hypothetical protein